MQRRNAAYPEVEAKPKHHGAMHAAEVEEFMLDCFVHERKHQDVKDFGGRVHGKAFAQGLLQHSLWKQVGIANASCA